VGGKGVTPHLLGYLAKASQGRTLRANCDLLIENAKLAGEVSARLAN
jgi:pseudouridine-5'-phosphate glycosidase